MTDHQEGQGAVPKNKNTDKDKSTKQHKGKHRQADAHLKSLHKLTRRTHRLHGELLTHAEKAQQRAATVGSLLSEAEHALSAFVQAAAGRLETRMARVAEGVAGAVDELDAMTAELHVEPAPRARAPRRARGTSATAGPARQRARGAAAAKSSAANRTRASVRANGATTPDGDRRRTRSGAVAAKRVVKARAVASNQGARSPGVPMPPSPTNTVSEPPPA